MSKIICFNENCPHRSKRPLRKYILSNGNKAYSCSLPITLIRPVYDCDGDILSMLGYHPCECFQYKADEEAKLIEEANDER